MVSIWLVVSRFVSISPAWTGPFFTRPGRLQKRFVLVFRAVCAGSARRAFADLENRQRRKSFVGSNPTPSVFFSEKTQRVSVRGCPDRRSKHRRMKRAVISDRGPPALVSSGSRGPEIPAGKGAPSKGLVGLSWEPPGSGVPRQACPQSGCQGAPASGVDLSIASIFRPVAESRGWMIVLPRCVRFRSFRLAVASMMSCCVKRP